MKDALPGQNILDRVISWIAPQTGAMRMRARAMIRTFSGAYEAAHPSRMNKWARDYGSGSNVTRWAHMPLRVRARDLERNLDVFRGALSIVARNTIGPHGIGVEPHPKNLAGDVYDDLAQAMHRLWRDWQKRPEASRTLDYGAMQRMKARSWFRDGEFLTQHLIGNIPGLRHATRVPYSQELIECDLLPVYLDDRSRGIIQGVERNAWMQPTGFWLYKGNPQDYMTLPADFELKRVPAQQIMHLKLIDRVHQVRGISVAAAVMSRLLDIKDYEDSERIAAKVAASMTAFIQRGTIEDWSPPTDANGNPLPDNQAPQMQMAAGQIYRLRPGENVSTIDTKRPNPNVETFRSGQLRAAAAGLEVSYSSLSKNYNGTYSAQRQELVEQWGAYACISAEFTSMDARPTYEAFINTAIASGALDLRKFKDLDPETLLDAFYVFPPMPWINPIDETEALQMQEESCYKSAPEIIRSRGAHPDDVLKQEAGWRKKANDQGVTLAADSPALPTPRPMNRPRTMNWDQ